MWIRLSGCSEPALWRGSAAITPNSQAGHQPFRLVTELPVRLGRIHNAPKYRGESRAGMGIAKRRPEFQGPDRTGMVMRASRFPLVIRGRETDAHGGSACI